MTVNHDVVGSSPTAGVRYKKQEEHSSCFLCFKTRITCNKNNQLVHDNNFKETNTEQRPRTPGSLID